MPKNLRSHLEQSLEKFQAFPTALTDRQAILRLIESLRPLSTNHELIRVGCDGDGGYLLPDDLANLVACFSPGVGNVSAFEADCANRGMAIQMADGSVDGPAAEHPGFEFTKKFVGAVANRTTMTLDEWVSNTAEAQQGDLLLQMDVEGSEYEVFLSMSRTLLERFRVIVVEMHMLDQLWSRPFFRLASRVFEKILQTHACVHLHPNNCCGVIEKGALEIPRVMELTLLRRDRIEAFQPATDFPHPLDQDNTRNSPLPLPRCWYNTTDPG
jgi:FkbM family methyltransferase